VSITTTRRVEGCFDIVTGPRRLIGKVRLKFSPSEELIFVGGVDKNIAAESDYEEWLSAICMEVLNVMLVYSATPVTRFRCVKREIDIHPVFSSWEAFRLATRQATENFLRDEPFVILPTAI
jgi:hypothetical protein